MMKDYFYKGRYTITGNLDAMLIGDLPRHKDPVDAVFIAFYDLHRLALNHVFIILLVAMGIHISG